MYSVKEAFYTLQGEGGQAGRPAVFCRFSGCNLWSGREKDRARAQCRFCDTDFVGTDGEGGGQFSSAEALADHINGLWPRTDREYARPYVVFTGGEPALQLDEAVIDQLHQQGFEVAIETNGTLPLPLGIDWICVSPKADTDLVITRGNELKLVYPQIEPAAQPEQFEQLDFDLFFIQPMDGPEQRENCSKAVDFCLKHPKWRISLQTHKILDIN